MSRADFSSPRSIPDATRIPIVGYSDRIGLVGTAGVEPSLLRAGGAARVDSAWTIERSAKVSLDLLDKWLPRYARRTIVPDVVDLAPDTSWFSVLANMLDATSWKILREVTCVRSGGCMECGASGRLECHEVWSYDDQASSQKLTVLKSLCGSCHEAHDLGTASRKGRYAASLARLVAMNRIARSETEDYEAQIFSKYLRRSEMSWSLDLSSLSDIGLVMRKGFGIVSPGVVCGPGRAGMVEIPILGVQVAMTPRGVTIL